MMNMILSVILSFAMIFSGTAALPAQPESATTWTLRNLTISDGTQSVTLAPEVKVAGQLGSEGLGLAFEVVSGGESILPLAGELTADGVSFTLGGENVYTLSDDALMGMMDLDAEDAQALEIVTGLFQSYGSLLGRTMGDPAFMQEYADLTTQILLDSCGAVSTPIEIEVDGEVYPAEEYALEFSVEAITALLEGMRSCGIAEVEALMETILKLVNLSEGTEYASFNDLLQDEGEEIPTLPMTLVLSRQENFMYQAAGYTIEQDGVAVNTYVEVVQAPEYIREDMSMTMDIDGGTDQASTGYDFSMELTGPWNNPTEMNVVMDVLVSNSGEVLDDEMRTIGEYGSENSWRITLDSVLEDGLRTSVVDVDGANSEYSNSEDESGESTTYFNYVLDASERAEEDGSITTLVTLDECMEGMDPIRYLSFELNRSKGEAMDLFAGKTPLDMGSGDESVMEQLSMDAMALMGSAGVLMEDESVLAAMEMFSSYMVADEEYEEYEEYDDYDDYGDYETEDEGYRTVTSFEEAAAIFGEALPTITMPEDAVLQEILVDEYSLGAYYELPEGSFDFSLYAYDGEGVEYYVLDGGLTPLEHSVVEMQTDGEEVYFATVYTKEGPVYFSFGSMTPERAAEIIAGVAY